jgi:hypothetical protein
MAARVVRRTPSAATQLAGFLARYDPKVAAMARGTLRRLRRRLPGATELVYDNYNALAIGFGPGERASEVILSIAVYPRWVTLFFLRGVALADPAGLLRGGGSRVRHIVLRPDLQVDAAPVDRLIGAALAAAAKPIEPRARRRLIIRAVSAKQRPRRPRATR